jgi:hypothetical protein
VLVGLLAYTVIGISNTRYTLPALVLLPLCVAGAGWSSYHEVLAKGLTTGLARDRARLVGVARASAVVLLVVAIAHTVWAEHRRATRTSGGPDGQRLGDVIKAISIDQGDARFELWGDQMVDQRPEVFMEASMRAGSQGVVVTPRWVPAGETIVLPPERSFLVLRVDDLPRSALEPGPELARYEAAGVLEGWPVVFEGKAHNFRYRVYQRPAIVGE